MKRKSITLSTNTNACLSHLHHLFFPQIRGLQRVPPLPLRKLHNHYDGKDSKPTAIPLGWKREEIISYLLQEFSLKISDSISIRWLFTFGYFYLIVEFSKFLKISILSLNVCDFRRREHLKFLHISHKRSLRCPPIKEALSMYISRSSNYY